MKAITVKGASTCGMGTFRHSGRGIKVQWELPTASGLWSAGNGRKVKIYALELEGVDEEDFEYGTLNAYFTLKSWDPDKHGLIYTDDKFLKEFRKLLNSIGLPGRNVYYSEQGMQGDNYVNMDVGKGFIKAWKKLVPAKVWRATVDNY